MREAQRLCLIQLLTAGYDKIDLKLCGEMGLPVATNGGANSWSVAAHSIALLLALYKQLFACDQSVRAGTWRKPITGFNTFEVAGKTLGIMGAGNIGRKVAKRLKAFETEVLYYDAFPSAELETEIGACRVSLDELVAKADIISIHLPMLPDTRSLIGAREFAVMKPNAVIINTSRAEIVEENALIAALQENRILGAGLDVFYQEPVDPSHPLLSLENVILSPHSAGHGCEGWNRRIDFAWQNIQQVAAGQKPVSLARL